MTNRTLSTLLRVLIKKNIKEWEECLPIAEYAYNRARHSTTGKSPFEVVYGFNPLSPLDILPLPLQERTNLDATARASYIKKMHEDTRHTIERQVQRLATKLNVNKHPMIFNIGDLVWLHLRKGPLPQRTQVQASPSSRRTLQGASTLQRQRLQDQLTTTQVQCERHLQRQGPRTFPW